jgi:uncharacterized membrane protein YebE (DUF533 family)
VRAMLLIPLLLTSCAAVNRDGAIMLGGKGAAKGEGWALIYNGEKSFRDFTTLAGTVAAGYFATAAHKATEATSQVAAKEATKKHAASQATIQNGQNVHGAAYGTAVGAEVPGVVAPAPPVAPVVTP